MNPIIVASSAPGHPPLFSAWTIPHHRRRTPAIIAAAFGGGVDAATVQGQEGVPGRPHAAGVARPLRPPRSRSCASCGGIWTARRPSGTTPSDGGTPPLRRRDRPDHPAGTPLRPGFQGWRGSRSRPSRAFGDRPGSTPPAPEKFLRGRWRFGFVTYGAAGVGRKVRRPCRVRAVLRPVRTGQRLPPRVMLNLHAGGSRR